LEARKPGDRLLPLHQVALAQLGILHLWQKKDKAWEDTRPNLPTSTVPLNSPGSASVPMLRGHSTSSVDFACTFSPQSLVSSSLLSSALTPI